MKDKEQWSEPAEDIWSWSLWRFHYISLRPNTGFSQMSDKELRSEFVTNLNSRRVHHVNVHPNALYSLMKDKVHLSIFLEKILS